MYRDIAEIVSLITTSPTIFLALFVLLIWGKDAWACLGKADKTPMEWLILGVCISFLGSLVDNVYWGFVWSVDYVTGILHDILCEIGVIVNTVFRQGFGTAAAFCWVLPMS